MFRRSIQPVNLEPSNSESRDRNRSGYLPDIRFQAGGVLASAAFLTYVVGKITGVFFFSLFIPLAGAGFTLISLNQARTQIERWKLDRRERIAEIREKEARATAAERQADFTGLAAGSGYGAGFDHRLGRFFEFVKPSAGKTQEPDPPLEDLEPALPLVTRALAVALVGSQDGGKTTLMQHIMDHRGGRAVAIDPHGYEAKYGPDIPVVGIGKNYERINHVLAAIITESKRRYAGYRGQRFPELSVYIDETTLLKRNCPAFEEFQEMMFSESRKIGFRPVFCIHTENVNTWGLTGKGDLADGVMVVTVRYDEKTGQRWCEVSKGIKNKRAADFEAYALPGPHPLHIDRGEYAHEYDIDPEEAFGEKPEPAQDTKLRIAGLLPLPRRKGQTFEHWLSECCVIRADLQAQAGPLHLSYRAYCERLGEKPLTTVTFGKRMAKRFRKEKRGGRWFYQGVRLIR